MEVDVTVEEPRARVVRPEADRNVVARVSGVGRETSRDDVAPDGVVVIVLGGLSAANDGESMLRSRVWYQDTCQNAR